MKLAILDSWPNLKENAEREFIARFKIAARRVGVECCSVVTSADIQMADPDAVIVSHEFSRKLTEHPTIGLMWSPLSFFSTDPYRIKSVSSYDGYLAGNKAIRLYLEDLQQGVGIRKPVSSGYFLPTCPAGLPTQIVKDFRRATLCYVGVHWEGARHHALFDKMADDRLITVYGPSDSWTHLPHVYGGYIPFDGTSLTNTIASHGIALCMHKAEHRAENTPSMRIFEALSVGALLICDSIPFAVENLHGKALFIDTNLDAADLAEQISEAVLWANSHPDEAARMALEGRRWFEANWSLELKIEQEILPLVERVREAGLFIGHASPKNAPELAKAQNPACEVIIRSGGRDARYAKRAIESVKKANSAELPLGILLVDYADREDLKALCEDENDGFLAIRYVSSANTGYRSTSLVDGIKAVKAPLVSLLDDDDTVFPNHYRQLAATLNLYADKSFAYSGVIRVEDDPGIYHAAPNFNGPLEVEIKEPRKLEFLDSFDLKRLATMDNFIQSNTWMARSEFLKTLMPEDPCLEVVEDLYMYLKAASRGAFAFTGSPTALWHWRSGGESNSMTAVDQSIWVSCASRVKLRLRNLSFNSHTTFEQLNHVLVTQAPKEEEEEAAEQLPTFRLHESVEGGFLLASLTERRGFHETDSAGIWTKRQAALLRFNLPTAVNRDGGVIEISFLGVPLETTQQWVQFSINSEPPVRVEVDDWSWKTLKIMVPPGGEDPVELHVRCAKVVKPSTGTSESRMLGVCIRSIKVDDQS